MASLIKCFKKNKNCESGDSNMNGNGHMKCECDRVEKLLECPECNTVLHGFWTKKEKRKEEVNNDGGICSKKVGDSSDDEARSLERDSNSDGNSPTTMLPPVNIGSANQSYVIGDNTEMAQAGISAPYDKYVRISKTDPNYYMGHRRRGKALIFNFEKWENTEIPCLDLKPRDGSEKDKNDLKKCLQKLAFEVETHDNLARRDYDRVIERVRDEDHSDADCLVVAIMTHGEKNSIYLADGASLPVNLIWEDFEADRCPSLAGKPKIFLIQACRGTRFDHGTRLTFNKNRRPSGQVNNVLDSGTFSYVIPNAADIFVAFSCPLGHYSWRDPEKGSWFIQSICKVFSEHAYDMELQSLLTTVAREVALNYESVSDFIEEHKKKQVPSTSSTLIRNVYFNKKKFVPYKMPHTPLRDHNRLNHSTQTPQSNGNVQPLITTEELASALATVSVNNEVNGNSGRPNALPIPLLTVVDSESTDKAQLAEEEITEVASASVELTSPQPSQEEESTTSDLSPNDFSAGSEDQFVVNIYR